MAEENTVELNPTGSNVEAFLGDTDVPPLVAESTETAAPKPFVTINKVILSPEMLNTARELFPKEKKKKIDAGDMSFPKTAAGFLANDLVDTMRVDFADRIEQDPNYLTYEGLRNGTAGILDEIETYAGKPSKSRMLSDDDIAKIFSNAEDAPFARAFFGELAKTVPALKAGMAATAYTGSKLFSKPIVKVPSPAMGLEYILKSGTALGAGLVAGFGVYSAADAIEEAFMGPDPVIVPGQRAAYEAYRTMGGGAANILFPFMLSRYGLNSGAQQVLDNLGTNIKGPLGVRLQAGLDKLLKSSADIATGSKAGAATTVIAETGGALGASGGAYLAESGESGTGGRLLSEFIGGNIGAITALKAIPKVITSLESKGGLEGMAETFGTDRQRKLFEKVNQFYDEYGTDEQRSLLIEQLSSPEFQLELAEAFPNVDFTVGQQSGDPLLLALEASKGRGNQKFAGGQKKAYTKAEQITKNFIDALISMGTEESVLAAGQLRQSLFEGTVENSLAEALLNQTNAALRLRNLPVVDGDPGQRGGPSPAKLSENLGTVLKDQIFKVMRQKERDLYSQIGARDHVVVDLSEGEPEFLTIFDELSYVDSGVQEDFLDSAPALKKFIAEVRESLEQAPSDIDPADLEMINVLSNEINDLRSGVPSGLRKVLEENLSRLKERFVQEKMTPTQQATALQDMADELFVESSSNPFNPGDLKRFARSLETEATLFRTKQQAGFSDEAAEFEPLTITAGRIDEIRSYALRLAREYSSGLTPSKDQYGVKLGQFANSLRKTLDDAEGGAPEEYLNALAFTRAKHDVVSRMIGAKAKASTKAGGKAVDNEVEFSVIINTNPSATLGRMRQLQALAKFADDQNLVEYAENAGVKAAVDPVFTTINNLAESYLRQTQIDKTFKRTFDPVANKEKFEVNDNALAEWRANNADLLETFPQLDIDTKDAVTFQRSLEFKAARKERIDKKGLIQDQLGVLLGSRSPTEAVAVAFNSTNPAESLRNLFGLKKVAADRGGFGRGASVRTRNVGRLQKIQAAGLKQEDINNGFRTAMLTHALMGAGGEVGGPTSTFDPKTFHKILFQPVKPNAKVSMAELALKNGVLSEPEFKRLKFMSTQMVRLQAADAAGKLGDPDFVAQAGPMVDFYAGIVGSAVGSSAYSSARGFLPGNLQSGQLAATTAGQKLIRNIFLNVPALQKMDMLDEVFMDAELVSKLLRKTQNPQDAERARISFAETLKEMLFTKGTEMIPFVGREAFEEDDNTMNAPYLGAPGLPESERRNRQKYIDRIQRNLPSNDQQGAVAPAPRPPVQRPSPVGPPTTQASAVPSPPPDPAPVNTGPVDRTRYAALFPNDMASGMIRQSQGIGSLI
jgi:hypothetical protein